MKNNGLEAQYFIEGHHTPIIDKNDWLLVQQIRKERRNSCRRYKAYKPRFVMRGVLAGFMIVDPRWSIDEVNLIIEKLFENE